MLVSQRQSDQNSEAQVEDYLDHVVAPLVGTVPYDRRRELRAELSVHLETMVEARMELGETREEAVEAALRQFGNPAKIGSEWLGEWRPKSESLLRTARLAATYFLPASAMAWFVATVLSPTETAAAVFFVLTVLPVCAGFVVGLLARSRPASGTLFGVLGLALVTGILGFVEAFVLGRLDQPVVMPLGALAAIEAVIWAPLGSLAALAGSALRRRVLITIRTVGPV